MPRFVWYQPRASKYVGTALSAPLSPHLSGAFFVLVRSRMPGADRSTAARYPRRTMIARPRLPSVMSTTSRPRRGWHRPRCSGWTEFLAEVGSSARLRSKTVHPPAIGIDPIAHALGAIEPERTAWVSVNPGIVAGVAVFAWTRALERQPFALGIGELQGHLHGARIMEIAYRVCGRVTCDWTPQ